MAFLSLNIFRRPVFYASALMAALVFCGTTARGQRPMGIDVSSYQGGSINWSNVKSSGITFAWAKAGEGTTFNSLTPQDSDFLINEVNAKAAGVMVGAYYFAHPELNLGIAGADTEAAYFWSIASNCVVGDGLSMMPVLDYETSPGSSYTKATSSQWVNEWCQDIVNYGAASGVTLTPVVYSYQLFASNWLDISATNWPLWISTGGGDLETGSPSPLAPWSTWAFWQYSQGTVPGVTTGAVDEDIFDGTSATLTNFLVTALSNAAPKITLLSPNAVGTIGNTIPLYVMANGATALSYQWRFNGAAIPLATNLQLLIPNAQTTNSGSYTVVVTNGYGAVTSAVVSVSVLSIKPGQAYAAQVLSANHQVQYRLNIGAASVQVAFDNGTTLTNFGPLTAGAQSFSLGNHTNFSIIVSNLGNSAPLQITTDGIQTDFFGPRGVTVNCNPASTNFGRLYIANANAGSDTYRATQRGCYALNADFTDAFGYGATAYPPVGTGAGQIQFGTSATFGPYHISVGMDDTVYLSDASGSAGSGKTVGGGVWMIAPNLLTATDLFTFNGTVNLPGLVCVPGTPQVTGSYATSNLVLYTLEWNRQPYNTVWKYNIGGAALPFGGSPAQLANAGVTNVNAVQADLVIAPDGKFFVDANRASGTGGNISLLVYAADGLTYLWDSETASGGNDPFVNSYGIAVSPDGQYVASGTGAGSIDVCDLTNGMPDLSTFIVIPAGFGGACRGVAWDMADNVYGVSGTDDLLRGFSLGLTNMAVTSGNVGGSNTSFQTLTGNSRPLILSQPSSQQIGLGGSAVLAVNALSVPPLAYQWQLNGTNLSGATGNILPVIGAAAGNAGSYDVIVSNVAGATTSSIVTLSITNSPVSFAANGQGIVLSNGVVKLLVTGLTGQGPLVLSASTNLMQWKPVLTNPSGFGQAQLIDSNALQYKSYFYRVTTP